MFGRVGEVAFGECRGNVVKIVGMGGILAEEKELIDDAVLHFARGLVGEGHCQYFAELQFARVDFGQQLRRKDEFEIETREQVRLSRTSRGTVDVERMLFILGDHDMMSKRSEYSEYSEYSEHSEYSDYLEYDLAKIRKKYDCNIILAQLND